MTDRPVLTLYTGTGCHLCDQARALLLPLLAAAGWQLREISITGNAELERRYGVRIPVVATADGRDKGWPFTAGQIRRLLR